MVPAPFIVVVDANVLFPLAARYQMYLPTEEELRAELAREREAAERALRLAPRVNGEDTGSGVSR